MADTVSPITTSTAMRTSHQSRIQSAKSHGTLDADIIIANAPDPVFVSDLEGKILSTTP